MMKEDSMRPDLRNKKEYACPDCETAVVFKQPQNNPDRCRLDACRCDRQNFDLPDGILFGPEGGPLFLYVTATT